MINKKGFTIAEVIVSFSLVSVILASIIGSTVYYRDKVKEEEVISQLIDFKNTVTKVIYDDILAIDNRKIVSVERCIGTANCVNLVDKDNHLRTLKIVEVEVTTSENKRGVYLSYDGIKYMLPDSDLGIGELRACDFVGGFDIEHYESGNLNLYTIKTAFKHKDLNQQYPIMFTIINNS